MPDGEPLSRDGAQTERVFPAHTRGSRRPPPKELSPEELRRLQELTGHRFRTPPLTAFITRAWKNWKGGVVETNERLEWFGDALVGMTVTRWLFKNQIANWTNARRKLVANANLAQVAERLGMMDFLRLFSDDVQHLSDGKNGHRHRQTLLANAYEALVGALAEDGGEEVMKAFVERTLLG